jgi:hypothetical protein
MKFFIAKKRMVKKLAEELAYLQIRADYWYYCWKWEMVDKENNITKQDMASSELELVSEVRNIAHGFGILKEVYEEAYKIYDFRNSGKKDFVPDIEHIEKLNKEFCEPRKKKRLIF